MAKTSVSDKTRPWVAILAKHHFWLLAIIVPLVLVPLLLVARSQLAGQIEAMRQQIKGHIDAMQAVRRIPQHPNSSWANDIDTSTMRVKRETFAEWRKFWDSQQALRVWPESLGPDFVKAMETLKPESKLSPRLLERYQNNVRTLVRELPARMGVADGMGDSTEARQALPIRQPQSLIRPGAGPMDAVQEASPYVASWNAENQKRIFASFNWDKKPTTAKVLLAQEELWVYAALCDVVSSVNKPATGPHNAAIASVDELFVGYPAAEDNPGGASGGRIMRSTATQAVDPMAAPPDMMASATPGTVVGRPPNPRFDGGQSGGGGAPPPPSPEGGAGPVDPDEMLRNWIYVDFSGKPLDAAQLAAAVDSQMVHLMPFVLRVVIDQRQVDALLVALSTAAVPIDVRQVRINAASGQAGLSGPSGLGGVSPVMEGPAAGPTGGGRFYDVNLELRGTVGLATPPNEKTVGLEPGQGDAAPVESGEKPASAPSAALWRRSIVRRRAA